MRSDALYLRDIVEAADFLAQFVDRIEFQAFQDSELLRSAIVQKLLVIGEAATRVSDALRGQSPDVPWARIGGFRNVLVHAYFGIDWNIVRHAATIEAPALRRQISDLLAANPE
jgi:uncharacterized protein with HEPN domain